jgi:A/G-specific adenine glycosylase
VRIPADIVLTWFDEHARRLPWREESATPWSVMVSEFMLQQTPVVRVLPVHTAWIDRWPTPSALAVEPAGEAVRMWGRLGYPRRALRLHRAAATIHADHHGHVPDCYDELRALPGVGDYTAAAIAAFAFRRRHPVLDTNVRRVLARAVSGNEFPARSPTRAERALADELLPRDQATAAAWSAAVMEVGALVCTASRPRCPACPLRETCKWRAAGSPAYPGPPRKAQTWAGTDRQCRGRLLAVLRDCDGPVHRSSLDRVWANEEQRARCLASLLADGLAVSTGADRYALP